MAVSSGRLKRSAATTGVALVSALVTGLGAAPASAESTPATDFSLSFSADLPRTQTDAALHILYKDPEDPDNPNAKPPALTSVTIAAPPGTVFDGAAVPACAASDAELMLEGPAACPTASGVGGGFGSVVADPGPPDPIIADVTLFNYGDGILELLTFPGNVNTVDRASFEGKNTLVLHPRVVPGFTEHEFSFTYLGAGSSAGEAFITTPPDCPPSGVWTSQLTYTVTTGDTYSAQSTTPCSSAAANGPNAIHASLRPRRVRAGEEVRIHVRLRSSNADCIANARVRLAGHDPVRTDDAGRATLVETFHGGGRRKLFAAKRGCAKDRATLRVLPTA